MRNVKYYKDLNHNYLIIKNDLDEQKLNYQNKMITGNRMRYLLPCKIRYVDGESHFYYEISSKQSIKSLFERKYIGYEELLRLFEQINEASAELENFLLDSRCLLLHPEYIYGEPETGEYFFLYHPDNQAGENENMDLLSLAEFLVERVAHEEEEAVAAAYRICELIQDDKFMLPQILKLFDAPEVKKGGEKEDEPIKAEMPMQWQEEESQPYDGLICKDEDRQAVRNLWIAGILAFLCMGGAAGIFFLGYYYPLLGEEKLLATVGIILLTLLSALLLLYFVINMIKYRKPAAGGSYEQNEASGSMDEKEAFSCESEACRKPEAKPEEYGNTVFLESSIHKKENKLYGTNKGNKYHINLDRLPCTIGKLAGSVDVVIKDSTISRIHARLSRSEEGIYVTDLNSTNGTFKNGLRLDPNESVLIEEGDELRFGKMTFCYR